jgi:hypothetical protein
MQWFVNFLRKKDIIKLFDLSASWDIVKWIITIGISQLFNGYVCTREHLGVRKWHTWGLFNSICIKATFLKKFCINIKLVWTNFIYIK